MASERIASVRPLASFEGLELAVPECPRGLGAPIGAADSPELIEGVRIQPFPVYPDDRGYFLEVQRLGQPLETRHPRDQDPKSHRLQSQPCEVLP